MITGELMSEVKVDIDVDKGGERAYHRFQPGEIRERGPRADE
jgi:hypothetical protein